MDCYQLIKAGIGWGYNFEAILNFEAMLNFEAKLNIEPMLNIKAMLNIETMLIVEAMLNFEAMSTGTSEKTHLLMSQWGHPLYFGCRDGDPIHIVLLLMQ